MKRKPTTFGTKRHAPPAGLTSPGDEIARSVNALLTMRVEEGCARAWSELADIFGIATLFPNNDRSSVWAESGIRVMIDGLTRELTKLTVAALLLPPPKSPTRPLRLVPLPSDTNGHTPVARSS